MADGALKRLSCGIVILNPRDELLLCHVTGHDHWDLPKGGIDPGESPRQAALRETREETGLILDAGALTDLGRFAFAERRDLHLFAVRVDAFDSTRLFCDSHFVHPWSGRSLPEMDGFGWFDLARAPGLCGTKVARVLGAALDLPALARRLDGGVPVVPRLAMRRFDRLVTQPLAA